MKMNQFILSFIWVVFLSCCSERTHDTRLLEKKIEETAHQVRSQGGDPAQTQASASLVVGESASSSSSGARLESSPMTLQQVLESFDIRVLPQSLNSRNLVAEPGDWEDPLTIEKVVIDQQIQILTTLVMNELDSRPSGAFRDFFIAWQNQWLGQRIRSVQFYHRVERADGSYLLSHQSQDVFFDVERQLFYFSSAQLIHAQYRAHEVDPTHLQVIRLELLLEDGSRQTVTLKLRMCGPLPDVRRERQSLVNQRSNQELIEAIRHDQKIDVLTESFENPTDRSLYLWVKARELGSHSLLKAFVDFSEIHDHFRGFPLERRGKKTYEVGLKLARLNITRSVRGQPATEQLMSLVPGEWLRLDLGPQERVTLKWRVGRREGMREVVLPGAESVRVLKIYEKYSPIFYIIPEQIQRLHRAAGPQDVFHNDGQYGYILSDIQTYHRRVGALFEMALNREIRLGYGFRSPEGLVEGPEWSQSGDQNRLRNYQVIGEPLPLHRHCSGDCTPASEGRDTYLGMYIR